MNTKTMIKKISTLVAFFFLIGIANAQIVGIPNVNFKNKLIQLGIDTNSDGDIQVSEALVPTTLNLDASNITDLTGIEAFVNLQNLFCENNQLTSIDLNALTNLQTLTCSNNQLTGIDLGTLTNLQILNCSNNQLTSLNLSSSPNLQKLTCNENQLTSINVTGLTNLQGISCHSNQLSTLDVSTLVNLQTLTCHSNQITNLNVTALANLQYLACQFNLLTNLDASNLADLETLICHNNQLNSLDVSNLVNLQNLECNNNLLASINLSTLTNLQLLQCTSNQIVNLDLSATTNLQELFCSNNQLVGLSVNNLINLRILECTDNQLSTIDLTNSPSIDNLNCDNNQLVSLDVSALTNLITLSCENNQLINLFLKNGISEISSFQGNPGLAFVCVDADELLAIQNLATNYGYTNCLVNTYCSITPGGDYNTITGTVIFDQNNNGCGSSDPTVELMQVGIETGATLGATFTTLSGVHTVYAEIGSYDLTLNMENPAYFSSSPVTGNVVFGNDNNNSITQDFCLTANGIMNDLEVVLAPIIPAVPGFDAVYELVYKNKGNQTLSGNVQFTYDDAVLDLISTSIAEDAQSIGSLTWNFSNLLPFETKKITITMNVNSSVETPAVNINDVLPFNVAINPPSGDALPLDNVFSLNQIVVDDYQPNEVECLEGTEVTPNYIGEYLHYVIRFENTANNPAEFVVVKTDVNPDEFDIESMQILSASHEFYARTIGNQVEFIFENIDLAGLQGDEGGHGHIILKFQSITDLEINDTVSKMANVFYDYNLPFVTNNANTVFKPLGLEISEIEFGNQISVYPNPTKSKIVIESKERMDEIEVLDLTGKMIFTKTCENMNETIDISNFEDGIYLLQVKSKNEILTMRIVKK